MRLLVAACLLAAIAAQPPDGQRERVNPCAVALCPSGTVCIERDGQAICQPREDLPAECHLPMDRGHSQCLLTRSRPLYSLMWAFFDRYTIKYYYDKARGTCRSFPYFGCGGNANQFSSLTKCLNTCVHKTEAPPCTNAPCPLCREGDRRVKETDANGCVVRCTCRPPTHEELCREKNCPPGSRCVIATPGCTPEGVADGSCPRAFASCAPPEPCINALCPTCREGDRKVERRDARGCVVSCTCRPPTHEELCQDKNCPPGSRCVIATPGCTPEGVADGSCPRAFASCTPDRSTCPQLDCLAFTSCINPPGFKLDQNGCPTCECASTLFTDQRCPDGSEPERNDAGQQKFCGRGPNREECGAGYRCEIAPNDAYALCCKEQGRCKPVMCRMACKYGWAKDADGCDICACLDPPVDKLCEARQCPPGSTCSVVTPKCTPGTQCPPPRAVCDAQCAPVLCQMYCEFGWAKNGLGCDICRCAGPPIDKVCELKKCPPGTRCLIATPDCAPDADYCPGPTASCVVDRSTCPQHDCLPRTYCPTPPGFKVDEYGCPTCECASSPPIPPLPCELECPANQRCVLEQVQCVRAPCPPQPVCQPNPNCKPWICRKYCEKGFAVNEDNCQICQCKEPTCEDTKCGPNQKCVMQPSLCATRDGQRECPLLPICRPDPDCQPVTCRKFCQNGWDVDENNCEICECKPPAPSCEDKACPANQKCVMQASLCATQDGQRDCPILPICRLNPDCQPVTCLMMCPHGWDVDDNNCEICKCKPAPSCEDQKCGPNQKCMMIPTACATRDGPSTCPKLPMCMDCPLAACPLDCDTETVAGADGCPVCRCKPVDTNPCAKKKCADGETCHNVQDCRGVGCTPRAECHACPTVVCPLGCTHTETVTKAGCPVCRCKLVDDDPCQATTCPANQKCELVLPPCAPPTPEIPNPACKPQPVCRNNPACTPVMCRMFCRYGWDVDEDNCETCRCKRAPPPVCDGGCPEGQRCQLVSVQCVTTPCEPQPQCRPCPRPDCPMDCGIERVRGKDGCPICRCAPTDMNPCKKNNCGEKKICRNVIPCEGIGCVPYPNCQDRPRVCLEPLSRRPCPAPPPGPPTPTPRTSGLPEGIPTPSTWYYAAVEGECKQAPPGVCGDNIFPTEAACQKRCTGGDLVQCRRVLCKLGCPFGFDRDENNCEVCQCKLPPRCTKKCPAGQKCVFQQVQCVTAPCPPVQVCEAECPRLKCVPCETGYVKDERGCNTCQCQPPPVCDLMCRPGYECKLFPPNCVQAPCDIPPIRRCMPLPKPECGPFEKLNDCASCIAEPTCSQPVPADRICTAVCRSRCECLPGYIRDQNNRCIRREECPARDNQCGPFETFNPCGTSCKIEPTCAVPRPVNPVVCTLECKPRCECLPGYVRDENKRCVRSTDCANQATCRDNEVYNECLSACRSTPTCADPDPQPDPALLCPAVCVKDCVCKSGFLRDEKGLCISKDQCP